MNISVYTHRYFSNFLLIVLLLLTNGCFTKNAEPLKNQTVTVYMDHLGENDSLIFAKFQKEEKIKVYFKVLPTDSILLFIQQEKYNSYADLIILHGADKLQEASKNKLFATLSLGKLLAETDKNYISPGKNWVALSKSPTVLLYDGRILKSDTISFYNEVLQPKWKGKIALQAQSSSTLKVLAQSLRQLNSKYKYFTSDLERQSTVPKLGNDLQQIKRINNGEAQLAFAELTSLIIANERKDTLRQAIYRNIKVIFPGQTQKGSFYNVTGGGVHKYARNAQNAEKLLQFLSSKRAQYAFAAGRIEFPVKQHVPADYRLNEYGKFRARFVANRTVKHK